MPQTKPPVRHQLSKCACAKSNHKKNTENEDERSLNNKLELIFDVMKGTRRHLFRVNRRKMAARGTGIEDHYHYVRGSYNVE